MVVLIAKNQPSSRKDAIPTTGVACFDFDGTLIRFDSFPLFLALIVGWPKLINFFFKALGRLLLLKHQDWPDPNRRSSLKIYLAKAILKGQSVDFLKKTIIPRLKAKIRWHQEVVNKLRWHKDQGHLVVIVSGGLQLYLSDLLQDMPIDFIIATDLIIKDGYLTGELKGENCVRQAKPNRIKAYLEKLDKGKKSPLWVYGNSRSDIPMLKIAHHSFWIKRGKIKPWKKVEIE